MMRLIAVWVEAGGGNVLLTAHFLFTAEKETDNLYHSHPFAIKVGSISKGSGSKGSVICHIVAWSIRWNLSMAGT